MRFSVVDDTAYRDAQDAVTELHRLQSTGRSPSVYVVEFDTTARVNHFYRVEDEDSETFYVRTAAEIIRGDSGSVDYQKISVFPFLAPGEKSKRYQK